MWKTPRCRPGKAWSRSVASLLLWMVTGGVTTARIEAQVASEIVGEVVLDGPGASEVRAAEEAFARTMADRDFEAFLTFVSPEAVFFTGDRPLRGIPAIDAAWRPLYQGESAPFSWAPDIVQVLESGDLAFTSGPVVDASGRRVGRFNSIWRKDPDGRWRVVFDRGS